ncbi:SRS domain-containing protein [Neospora caninum Liverpool]|uniref:SRS domain-containing protein n=1 Tax=Neospora caninum (strain Liverpool) TaxID=572307 RepID=F0VGY5_NEOCL|nr:SRS domain-containing protein [Neospora caninum Liverpool]CBZ52979.1 SRS domain-containing protein [Neospora caninum Liverpool]CEL66965.1 TPA: SRS domain-containing protein [Neospora caninum Liverpool]|eukprot:XP_003883011.1 SRS domain-containing protein [Neospora caninum Liverpool]
MARYLVHAGGVFRPLGRALLLAGLIQFVNRTAQSEAAQAMTENCESGEIQVSLTPGNLAVKLTCSGKSTLSPSESKALKYSNGNCEDGDKTFDELLGEGATATWKGSQLEITKLPTEAKQICYKCKDEQAVTCTAVINVPSQPKSCKTAVLPSRSLKAASGDLVLEVDGTEPVYFTCPDSHTLDPSETNQAYIGADECGTSPTAREDLQRKGDQRKAYSFQLTKEPTKQETFCYKCRKARGKAGDECTIKIKSVTTTTTTATGSSADDESTDSTTSGAATLNYITGLVCAATMWLGYLL